MCKMREEGADDDEGDSLLPQKHHMQLLVIY